MLKEINNIINKFYRISYEKIHANDSFIFFNNHIL